MKIAIELDLSCPSTAKHRGVRLVSRRACARRCADMVARGADDFESAAARVLEKNAELYAAELMRLRTLGEVPPARRMPRRRRGRRGADLGAIASATFHLSIVGGPTHTDAHREGAALATR